MEIRLNGKTADITLDNEKTTGEVMAGLEQWLAGSGHRLSGFSIDGHAAILSQFEDFFSREIDTVKVLDISTISLAELAAESLVNLLADIEEYENLNFEDKNIFFNNWNEKAQSLFTKEQMPDLYGFFIDLFSGQINPRVVYSITEERLREVKDPPAEFSNIQPLVEETCARLADIALDIQTGKEGRAAQTIQIFSSIAEKILRIIKQLNIQGYLSQKTDDDKPFNQTIGEFGGLIKDLHEAYERRDTILVGDIAEYEASPKLQELYTAILKNTDSKNLNSKNINRHVEQVKI
ncbi:MAG: hypothetical protein LBQ93_10245 [Treponema sp.]|jgi:hypothetical protein|nr:hypothetical protein [Treponema sp.]